MSNGTLQLPAPARPQTSTLAQKTVSGFFWLTAQTVGSKLVNMVGQVILARLLLPEAWGLVGEAYSVSAFAVFIQQAGLREILIQRQSHFGRWANPAFWMSLTLGCLGALVMVILAPVAAWVYEDWHFSGPPPSVFYLVLLLALSTPFAGLDIVPDAKLTSELRFRFLAWIKWFTAVGTMGLSIVFAKMGLGAKAFVLPLPIITVIRLVLLWSVARPPIRWHLHFRRWKYLMNDSVTLFMANFCNTVTWYGDYIILGIMHDAKSVGIYFFAFNLATQTMQVFTQNLIGVLFPALSKLQDNIVYQTRAFLRAAELLALIGVPMCLLQAALAGPAINILFNSWWQPMIRVLQLLSIGMAVRLVASPGGALIQAQGRFRTYFVTNAINMAVFLGMVYFGSWLGKQELHHFARTGNIAAANLLPAARDVAAGVTGYFTLIGPIFLYIAIRPGGGKWRDIWHVYFAPTVASIVAIGVGIGFGRWVQAMPMANDAVRQVLRIIVITLWSIAIYIPLIRIMNPPAFKELVSRLSGFIRSRTDRMSPPPSTPPPAAAVAVTVQQN